MAGKNDQGRTAATTANDFRNIPVADLKGVGPKRASLLFKKGINTIPDLFYLIPRCYEDRSKYITLGQLEDGKSSLVRGKVIRAGEERLFGHRKRLYKIIIGEGTHRLELVWFNVKKDFFSALSIPGMEISAYGTAKRAGNKMHMYHPDVSVPDKHDETSPFPPLYPAIDGLSDRILRSIIKTALDRYLDLMIDPVPSDLLLKEDLPNLRETIRQLHFPDRGMDYDLLKTLDTPYHKRIFFDRFFNLMLRIFHNRQQTRDTSVAPLKITEQLLEKIIKSFPFDLTEDQMRGIREIRSDLISGRPMNRLIMGDVGTGKTVIAIAAAAMVIKNSYQVAFMAPTQLLAEQHMAYLQSFPSEMGFKPVLLTGNLKKKAREEIYSSVRRGLFNIVIGTHSLLQDRLAFGNLGLAIIDEQHRFGVRQRSTIIEKGKDVHVLYMSATPIPRTIAIILYGDRDLTIVKQYPGGRVPVDTVIADRSDKRWILDTVKDKLSVGRQVYVICPLIDESENMELKSVVEMAAGLNKLLGDRYRVEYIHGQLDTLKKESTLCAFREGKINILVATTVIEVGIHVPNASLMIIEHPERLGLAQLHQLRGRIGRDGKGGTCILVSPENTTGKTGKRLRIMTECDNGFEIAEKDMEARGHGEITGTRQSGFSEFEIMDILKHHSLFKKAGNMAENIFRTDPDLSLPEHRNIKSILNNAPNITT